MIRGSTMTRDFYDNLYFGLGYEYHAAGHLWRLGWEAYKIDADFGFDLLVYNQGRRTHKAEKDKKPYLFQVKAARIQEWETSYSRKTGSRNIQRVRFYLNKEHLRWLVEEPNAYGIFYFVYTDDEKEEIVHYFWLSNEHLKFLYDRSDSDVTWFQSVSENRNRVYLEARIRTEASLDEDVQKCLTDLKEEVQKNKSKSLEESFDHLCGLLDKAKIINKNSHSYVELIGKDQKGKDYHQMLNYHLYELANFEKNYKLFM